MQFIKSKWAEEMRQEMKCVFIFIRNNDKER